MRPTATSLAALALLLGGACTSAGGGLTLAEVQRCPDGGSVCAVELRDGKERDHVVVDVQGPDWSARYEARTVRAFEGQAIRAALERAIAAELGQVPTGLVDRLLKALRGLP